MGRSNWWEIPFTKTRCNRHRVQIITKTTTTIAIDTIATSSLHSTAQLVRQKKSLVTRRRFTFPVLIHTNNRAHFGMFELLPSLLHRHTHTFTRTLNNFFLRGQLRYRSHWSITLAGISLLEIPSRSDTLRLRRSPCRTKEVGWKLRNSKHNTTPFFAGWNGKKLLKKTKRNFFSRSGLTHLDAIETNSQPTKSSGA